MEKRGELWVSITTGVMNGLTFFAWGLMYAFTTFVCGSFGCNAGFGCHSPAGKTVMTSRKPAFEPVAGGGKKLSSFPRWRAWSLWMAMRYHLRRL